MSELNLDQDHATYLKAYKEGFYAAMKMCMALAIDMHGDVAEGDKDPNYYIRKYIEKLQS